jgi:phenylalanyl-tRNA synthetase alpha chain
VSSPVSYLDPVRLQRDLGLRDLSEPAEGRHAIQILIGQAVEGLCGAWGCEVRWCRGPRIVPVADNYDRLGYPAEAITREARYTRYVDAGHMLRSHASAMIPPALRRLARQPGGDDVLLACPGIVYRRDAIDWQHTGTPHQLDLWRITRRAMRNTDLDQMISVLLGALAPGRPYRQQPRTHPYTLGGRQVDVYHGGRWVEVGECGLAHPRVLAAAGLPGRSGLALGMGLDRLLMLVKHIPDIRLLRSGDPRITGQMLDLARYQHVSSMPPITRDLSVAVSGDEDEETLGDRVRDALGADASCVEEVRVLSATACRQLPASAISRLGARPGQKNLLVRVVLRDLEKTLTSPNANALRDRIYRALHQGTEYQWADDNSLTPDPAIGQGANGCLPW